MSSSFPSWLRLLILLSALPVALRAATAPPVIESGRYPDNAAAQTQWKPMAGSPPAEVADDDGGKVLRFRCAFESSSAERASWDREGSFDLSGGTAITFRFRCDDPAPVAHFNLFFQSGDGWYAQSFFPEKTGWNTIRMEKSAMNTEGRPGGWDKVRAIRLSAWRGGERATEFRLAGMQLAGLLGRDTFVLVVRGDSVGRARPDEEKSIKQFTAQTVRLFEESGVPCAVSGDEALASELLAAARLVVLPMNATLPKAASEALVRYLEGGGKLISCYGMPSGLRAAAGIAGGSYRRPEQEGGFAAMRFEKDVVPGVPETVGQHSWNIIEPQPVPGRSRVAAVWLDGQGRPAGANAVVVSDRAAEISHVLLDDDPAAKKRMLLALAGSLVPEVWSQAAATALERAGRVGSFNEAAPALAHIEKLAAGDSQATAFLAEARSLRAAAEKSLADKQYAAACDQAARSGQALLNAYCAAQKPAAGEFRAFWCHQAYGVPGENWEAAIARLEANGFNAILPNMLWGGLAYYPSEVLPVSPEVASRGDAVAECLAACRKHGLKMHVWKVNWNLGQAPKEFVEKMRSEGRLQAGRDGEEEPWLCPSHPENQKLEIAAMVEVARRYEVDGLHFDYIRYPDSNHCFCAGCRARFEAMLGRKIERWPEAIGQSSDLGRTWQDWRRGHITAVVRAVSQQARALRPGLKISAAVFRNWPADRDWVGQDWKLWCDEGWLDFVCPMDYTASNGQFGHWARQQIEWAGKVPCYPGIGAWVLGPDQVADQITLAREAGAKGFTIFNYNTEAARDLVPRLGLGATRAK